MKKFRKTNAEIKKAFDELMNQNKGKQESINLFENGSMKKIENY